MNPLMSRQQPNNPMQLMSQFKQNPVGALRQVGYNIPDGLSGSRQIVEHLVNSGQIGGQKLNQLRGMANALLRR